jgi:hypothetical protein
MNNSMMLVTGSWGNNKTFKMIPVTNDCPFNEAIFDRDGKVLALVGKEKKQSFHMLPKVTELGDVQTLKIGKRANGKDYAEERKTIETYYEYYIENPEEIEQIVKGFAVNADKFDFKQYMEAAAAQPSQIVTV